MPAKVKVIRARDFLQVAPNGDLDLETSKKLLVEAAWAKRPPADFDVLLDLRGADWELTMSEIATLADELGKHGETFRDKVAILTQSGHDEDSAEFFEKEARQDGFNVDVFTSFEDAIAWFFPPEELHRGEL